MRTWNGWLALLLTLGVALAPTSVRGQYAGPGTSPDIGQAQGGSGPEPGTTDTGVLFTPLNNRPERGGFYFSTEFIMFRMDNDLKHQVIARRGFQDTDGSVTADVNGTVVNNPGQPPIIIPGTAVPGTLYGSQTPALFADDAAGPLSFQPGVRITAGWKFQDGLAVEFSWMTVTEAKYGAVATLANPGGNAGPLLADSFLFSPVYNFPNDFAGAANKIALGNPLAVYGIWNGASVESISFTQRFDQYELKARQLIFQTDPQYCRCYGLTGIRHVSLWENFKWRTVSEDFTGNAGPDDVGLYSDTVSNQLYGVFLGLGMDWYLGNAFAISLEGTACANVDMVNEIARYERSDLVIANKRAQRQNTFAPELAASLNVTWYPWRSVEIRVGYEFMSFFNTIAAPQPVSFNYGGLDVNYESATRFLNGFNIGISFLF